MQRGIQKVYGQFKGRGMKRLVLILMVALMLCGCEEVKEYDGTPITDVITYEIPKGYKIWGIKNSDDSVIGFDLAKKEKHISISLEEYDGAPTQETDYEPLENYACDEKINVNGETGYITNGDKYILLAEHEGSVIRIEGDSKKAFRKVVGSVKWKK